MGWLVCEWRSVVRKRETEEKGWEQERQEGGNSGVGLRVRGGVRVNMRKGQTHTDTWRSACVE